MQGQAIQQGDPEVTYKGKNIAAVLDMTVEEALSFFENIPSIKRKLQMLYDVGLGYIKLGQPSTTLSGARQADKAHEGTCKEGYGKHHLPSR
jgi:excinuclease UvrABC ATPase subunit